MKIKVLVDPNPFTTALWIHLNGSFAVNVVIRLINKNGTVVRIAGCELKKGDNKIAIDNLQRYAAGVYSLEIKLLNGETLETVSLVKL